MQNGQTFGIWSDDPFRANQSKRVKSVDTDQTAPFRTNQINPTEPAQTGAMSSYEHDRYIRALLRLMGQG